MPPPYSCCLIGVRGAPVPVEMGGWGEGVARESLGRQGWNIITDSLLANMKQVKDLIWLREVEHAEEGCLRTSTFSSFGLFSL